MGALLRVRAVYPTIQGEGVLAGTPMVIVRTQGCSVGCGWCDTKETWNPHRGTAYSPGSLVDSVRGMATGHRWVLLTGGEPVQQDCEDHIAALQAAGYSVALETSGNGDFIPSNCSWFCLSPKHKPFADKCRDFADEVKFIISSEEDVASAVSMMEAGWAKASPSLQPVWESTAALAVCINACQRLGWRLSVQTHKYLGVR